MNKENKLIGSIIVGVVVSPNGESISLGLSDGKVVTATAYGDCCSHSWIENVDLPALGFPCTVTAVEDVDMPGEEYDADEHECLQFYGCRISTDKGDILIDYRNSSNGYYGGSLEWPEGYGRYW